MSYFDSNFTLKIHSVRIENSEVRLGCHKTFLMVAGCQKPKKVNNHFFRPSIVSLISNKASAYKTFFIKPSLAFSITTSTIIANNKGDKTDP